MRHSGSREARNAGDVRLVAAVLGIFFVLFGYTMIVEWIMGEPDPRPAEARERRASDPRDRVEHQVQKKIDSYIRKHGKKPERLRDVDRGLAARLHQRLPTYFDVEYDPGTAKVRVFEIDPFVPGPTRLSVFGAIGEPAFRADMFQSMLRGLLKGYKERYGRYPEDVRDVVEGRMGRGFRLPVGYRLEYDPVTGSADVAPE